MVSDAAALAICVPNFVPDSANMTPVKLVQLGHIWPY